jgi:Uma2 family endonuclease
MREVAHDMEVPDGWRVEIIEGVMIVSPMPSSKHGTAIRRVEQQLAQQLPDGCDYRQNLGVEKEPGSDDYAIPDLFVAPEAVFDADVTMVSPEELLLAVEVVSPSSMAVDRTMKVAQYAKSRIPLYLIVDPFRQELVLHSDPVDGAYQGRHRFEWGAKVVLPDPLPAVIDSSVFPEPWGDGRA